GLREPEEALRLAEADVVNDERGLVARMRKERMVDEVAVEEIDDRNRDDRRERRPPMDDREEQHAHREDAAHRHVEGIEEGRGLLEAIRVDEDVRGADDRKERTERRDGNLHLGESR